MGCLNSKGQFNHWFANIHLSGPCNRSCYFCIGQYMMALDSYNILNKFPLNGIDNFINECLDRNINEINMTGTNTDPMLYKHTDKLRNYLDKNINNLYFKIRTNAVKPNYDLFKLYDGGSVTICSFDNDIYKNMMGQGKPPNIYKIIDNTKHWKDLKINIVLGEENYQYDIFNTLKILDSIGVPLKVNLREPYGQPHIGNPLENFYVVNKWVYGNPCYIFNNIYVTYWDVHYTEVESVNLYANGHVSTTYPITKGHNFDKGKVKDQSNFIKGRNIKQWVNL